MLSPDNFVQNPGYAQNFNRYSYAFNNPLIYTDPSGEIFTWSLSKDGFSVGYNWAVETGGTVPLGAGVNIGSGDGLSVGVYGEVGFRAGGNGIGSGVFVSQSLDYNFRHEVWSTTTSAGAYASAGVFNVGMSASETYDLTNGGSTSGWSTTMGVSFYNEKHGEAGVGFSVGYGSNGWIYGVGGYYDPSVFEVYTSPVHDNFGREKGECALRCYEEFSKSYGMDQYNIDYWKDQNGGLGVNPNEPPCLADGSGVFFGDNIYSDYPESIKTAFINDKRVMMGFKAEGGGAHAVMVSKIKIYKSGGYRIYFKETSPVRLAPYSTSNYLTIPGARFYTFYPSR